ncbi:MAG: cupredoxin domain-containing protein [Actinomycetota bacterium]
MTILLARRGARPETIVMERLAFIPSRLKVSKGTVVLFENRDVSPHTVTADNRAFDSGLIGPGGAFRIRVDRSTSLHCEIHAGMAATLLVSG